MSWHDGLAITHKYHSDFVEMREMPCDVEKWFDLQYQYGGTYDSIEVDPEWASLTTSKRLEKFLETNDIDHEFVIFQGEYISWDNIPFIDYDNGEKIKHIICKVSVHS
tara:strand:+ start:30 stop:353 length:324 start_codon:yes stop_codon:yes gene_type:complete